MGFDLRPISPSADAPRGADGQPTWGRYNISGWMELKTLLRAWDVDVSEFSSYNEGDPISAETCRRVADAIESHLPGLSAYHRRWLSGHAILWRTCGGYEQW